MQPDQPIDASYNQTIQRCAEAYHHVMAKMPKNVCTINEQRHWHKASLAYIAQLPILVDPPSFLLYIACVAQGVGIGAIDPADSGRLCHLAQTAMSAWKLVNIVIPEAERKEKQAAQKSEEKATLPPRKGNHPESHPTQSQPQSSAQSAQNPPRGEEKATPLPSKGNHPAESEIDQAILNALENMPILAVQKKHFQLLRNRGILLPSDGELRDHPLAALHFVRMSERLQREDALAEIAAHSQPDKEPGPEPTAAPSEQQNQAA